MPHIETTTPAHTQGFAQGDEQDLAARITEVYLRLADANRPAIEESLENFRYVERGSWTKEKEQQFIKSGMPVLNINLMWPKLLRISGQELQVRKRAQAVPVRGVETGASVAANDLFDLVEYNSDAQEQFSMAFLHALICEGLMGWVKADTSFDDDELGLPQIKYVNPFFVLDDPTIHPFDVKRRGVIIETWMAKYEEIDSIVARKWPEKRVALKKLRNDNRFGFMQRVTDAWQRIRGASAAIPSAEFINEREGTYRVIQMQVREHTQEIRVENVLNGKSGSVPLHLVPELLKYNHLSLSSVRGEKIRTITSIGGEVVVQNEYNDVQNGMMSLIPVPGVTISDKSLGMVTKMKSAQEEHNKRRSIILHILQSTAAGGWQVPEGSLDPEQQANLRERGNSPDYIQVFKRQFGRPEKIQPNSVPAGEAWAADRSVTDMEMISSIGPGEQGLRDGAKNNASLHRQEVQQAMFTIEPYLKKVDIAKKVMAIYVLDMFRAMVGKLESGEREFDIPRMERGKLKSFERVLINAEALGEKHSIVILPSLDTETNRNKFLEEFTVMEQTTPPELIPWHMKWKYTDLPQGDIDEIVSYIKARTGGSVEEQQGMAAQLQNIDLIAEQAGI